MSGEDLEPRSAVHGTKAASGLEPLFSKDMWHRAKSHFAEASRLDVEKRAKFLEELETRDRPVYLEVSQWLQNLEPDDDFLIHPFSKDQPLFSPEAFPGARLPQELGEGSGDLAVGARRQVGDYELIEPVGQGAMAVVWRARQISLDREVALKILQPQNTLSADRVAKFRLEATAAARISHPHVVPVYDVGQEQGTHYFSMKYVQGQSLAQALLQAHVAKDRRRRLLDALGGEGGFAAHIAAFVKPISLALSASHQVDVVHRDLKPGNILIDVEGQPHVADFGLAKDLRIESLVQTGSFGTPYYMSPEQTLLDGTKIDPRTDVFSIGVILYELLVGERPFEGDSLADVVREIRHRDPIPVHERVKDIPQDLSLITQKALEKNRDDRYPTANALANDLQRFLDHEAISVRPLRRRERVRNWVRKHRRRGLALGGVALLIFLAAFLGMTWQGRRETQAKVDRLLASGNTLSEMEYSTASLLREIGTQPDMVADREELMAIEKLADRLSAEAKAMLRRASQELSLSGATLVRSSLEEAPTTSLRDLFKAFLILGQEDGEGPSEEEHWLPSLTVTSNVQGAKVSICWLDQKYGQPMEPFRQIGSTPLDSTPIEPGYYRVLVQAGQGTYGEATCLIKDLQPMELHIPVVSVDEVRRDMIQVVTDVPVPIGNGPGDPIYATTEMTLQPFFIDRCEVTHAQYREFLLSGKVAPPRHWPEPYDPAFDDLPVVFVAFDQATAYASWAGKRLPSFAEWQRASCGLNGSTYPWGSKPAADQSRAVLGPAPIPDYDPEDWESRKAAFLPVFLEFVEPVHRFREDQSADGLLHVLGNVAELTESFLVQQGQDDRLRINPGTPLVMGGRWTQKPFVTVLPSLYPTPRELADFGIGFRCAKSVIP